MRFDEAYSGNQFIGAQQDYASAQAVIYGMPMDFTVSFRPGSRMGPKRIREVSIGLEEFSPYLDKGLEEVAYFDAGDIPLPFGNPGSSLEKIYAYVSGLFRDSKFPLGLGGEHLVSWPVIQAAHACYPDLCLLHIDAHADLRADYEGEVFSHATPVHKALQLLGGKNIYQFGIRSGMREEFQLARREVNFYPFEVLDPLKAVLPRLKGRRAYITIDIDVLDPAYAPGTGTAESGGIDSRELLAAVHAIAASELQVVGADVVEVAPILDPTEQTPIVAAKLVREILLGWVPQGGK